MSREQCLFLNRIELGSKCSQRYCLIKTMWVLVSQLDCSVAEVTAKQVRYGHEWVCFLKFAFLYTYFFCFPEMCQNKLHNWTNPNVHIRWLKLACTCDADVHWSIGIRFTHNASKNFEAGFGMGQPVWQLS